MSAAAENVQQVAVVTGASAGIGAQIAVLLANKGITVVGLARRSELIEDLNKQVTGDGKIHGRHCDLSQEECITAAFKYVRENFPPITILVCNAGMLKANFISESPGKDIKALFDLNVVATSICLREGVKLMSASKVKGHIIIMNSILGHRIPEVPVPLFSVYPATKHALTALCQTVRQEIHFLKLNIKLTSISPGMVDTDLLNVYSKAVAELPKLQAKDVAQAVIYALETPDYVQVEEIVLQAMARFNA
ncbi:farnesol dehydrogenase [Bactrocera dorsalis]|uniref:Farnesol dehydrogenase n=1 Tax=Bactrocera dorsalis TaxID=27457 RepID=A0A6I9V0J5_BACDO|nr:farnesol dehydrogenase [Bactrocera dorsalis]